MKSDELAKFGLNLFAAVEVSTLPQDIVDIFINQKIPFQPEDTLCVIASGGRDLWNHLPHPLNELEHPIDQFSITQIKKIDKDARVIFPHDEWNIPLQRLGRFLNLSRPSLLGLDINDEYGVWFAFRGAFLTTQKLKAKTKKHFESPCNRCVAKPCIKACPVGAVNSNCEFKLNECANHRLSSNSTCADRCLARLACSYQAQHQYKMEQIQYHMTRTVHLRKLSDYRT